MLDTRPMAVVVPVVVDVAVIVDAPIVVVGVVVDGDGDVNALI